MTVMQKEDEVDQSPSRNRLPLSLSLEVSGKGALSSVLRHDALLTSSSGTDTVYPCKRKISGGTSGGPAVGHSQQQHKGTAAKRPHLTTADSASGSATSSFSGPGSFSSSAAAFTASHNMLNGYRSGGEGQHSRGNASDDRESGDPLPVATLSNMGNTCYLNSVLYTLRFTPAFVHHLHHLADDLSSVHSRLAQVKAKSSSLGRNIGVSLGGSSSYRSSSSKDLLSLGGSNSTSNSSAEQCPKSKMQVATVKLHELFLQLHSLEMKDCSESFQPSAFLQALIEVNSLYQGNQQQDAHELLVYLLDILRETCDLLARQAENHLEDQGSLEMRIENGPLSLNSLNTGKSWTVRRSRKKNKEVAGGKKNDKGSAKGPREPVILEPEVNGACTNESDEQSSVEQPGDVGRQESKKKTTIGHNWVCEEFGGVTLRRTKCLECECVTERKEPFYDICVPISLQDGELELPPSEIYRSSCVTSENLRDTNKYWCDRCGRYNEACREVSYERLPNLLVLQLKRFSSSVNGPEKINSYLPTPLVLDCFCERCCRLLTERSVTNQAKPHSYQLYGVIMHLGATMASGHYIAYTRASEQRAHYADCLRDQQARSANSSSSNSGSGLSSFSSGTSDLSKNILKLFKPHKFHNSTLLGGGDLTVTKNGPVHTASVLCKSKDCCGIRMSRSVLENAINSSGRGGRAGSGRQTMVAAEDATSQLWLECDDDVVRTLSTEELQSLLGCRKNSPATPYLLFYSRIKDEASGAND